MSTPRDVLTPNTYAMLQVIADTGSFSAAARALDMVPSALSYRVRQVEEALDVLLFDRGSHKPHLTEAGVELLCQGAVLLADTDAVANRIKRVAQGWEAQLTIALDCIIDRSTVMELCEDFTNLNPLTRLKLRTETLSGTMEALTCGEADIALGIVADTRAEIGIQREMIGALHHVFTMAPQHPLARVAVPLKDEDIRKHRAVSIADSGTRGKAMTLGLLAGQDVITLTDINMMIDAQVKGLGVGYLPTHIAQPYLDSGRLVARDIVRSMPELQVSYAWRQSGRAGQGRALRWWLDQLASPTTRTALLWKRGRSSGV